VVKGWTLSDVPDAVVCEIKTHDSRFYTAWVNSGTVYHMDEGGNENAMRYKPSEYRVIRVIDPIPPGAMTWDMVPEGVRCVCTEEDVNLIVRVRTGDYASSTNGHQFFRARDYQVLHILDPLPGVTYTLESLPVGRVIEHDDKRLFKDMEGDWTELDEITGCPLILPLEQPPRPYKKWQVTDIIMELKEVV